MLFNILQTKSFDISYCLSKVTETSNHIKSMLNDFEKIWDKCVNRVGVPTRRHESKERFQKLYAEILNNILNQISVRFQDMKKVEFIDLLRVKPLKPLVNPLKFEQFAKSFPNGTFQALKIRHPNVFDYPRLHCELLALYSSHDFHLMYPHQILLFIHSNELNDCMPEIERLSSLILTIPSTSASVERSFSTLKRVKRFCRNSCGQARLSSLYMMSVEKELLSSLSSTQKFYDNVIQEFCKKERRIDLMFK